MRVKNQWLRGLFLVYALLLIPVAPLTAAEKSEPVRAQLLSEESAVSPGHPFWVAVELKMEKGWDTYWLNPGDSGFPTQVKWNLPEGFTAGPLLWPYPEKFVVDSLVAFGYKDSVLLMTEITPPQHFNGNQPIKISADVTWLACNESCIPGNASLTLTLPVGEKSLPKMNPTTAPLFTEARKALPQQERNLTIVTQADQLVLKLKPQPDWLNKIEGGQFIPEQGEIIDYMAPQNFRLEDGFVTLSVKRVHPTEELGVVKGILLLSEQGSQVKRAIQVDSTQAAREATNTPGVEGVSSVSMALIFAFLGGLILNVMPCVLPVVALKIFGFVKMAQQKRTLILQHGGVFALGVLISFWALSGALLVLRAYGEGIGWGFQLQEPVFVVILTLVLFLLGLSLFGVFELGTSLISLGNKTSQQKSPLTSSFMSGVLATLVATPCTGPLLGPALGFAMTLPSFQALSIFTFMGLGMASPYLLFSAFPHLVRFLPKPGNWMIVFKQLMGFLMMATVVWLLWVFGAQTDHMATFILLSALLITSIGA